ncbi:MAG TPA: sugar phosphate isomerase/epimerase [Candidatus Dormibacteraeota bacterium]|jgi:inosose dehydratase|nr:sugar phosphate isomerase/epimerase [Candidatus Dormibacteraeota bacterium]
MTQAHAPSSRRGEGQSGRSRICVAAAPVSFGAFEVTVGVDPDVPDAAYVLDAVAQSGYDGIDLGPPGYLGSRQDLHTHLESRGLRLAGGFMPMPFSDPAGMPSAMAELGTLLDLFDTVPSSGVAPGPKPTLADAGSAARRAAPGQAQANRELGLQAEAWDRLAENVGQVVDLCRRRGYEPTFHHHAGTYVEAPWEIDELLERTDVGLCLDSGHLALGGGDPLRAVGDWGERINHVHLKDIRRPVIEAVIREGGSMMDVWRRGAFCRLGTGDLDIDAILVALLGGSYRGWLVIEQDMIPSAGAPKDAAVLDQDRNRAYLRQRGL